MNLLRIVLLFGLVLLSACGGGGGGASQPTRTVSGVVVDGYLDGAKVCLDTNLNKKCDSNEPFAFTGAGGAYSILNVPVGDLTQYPILVEVPVGVVDAERGAVASAYVMSAPANHPEVVSPLTTLVQSQIESNGLSLDNAVTAVKNNLGLTTLSPLEDFSAGSGSSADAVVASGVAKVIASALGENIKGITAAVAGNATVTTQQVVNLSVQQIMQTLPQVALQVRSLTQNGSTALSESGVSSVISGTEVIVPTNDTATLQQELAASTGTGSTSAVLTIVLKGTGASTVSGLQATITLPAGVTVSATSQGTLLPGVLTAASGTGATFLTGKYTSASTTAATLQMACATTTTFAAGDLLTLKVNLAPGTSMPDAGAFSISSVKLIDVNGDSVSDATLSLR